MDPTVGAGRAAGVGEDTAGVPRGAGVGSEVGCDIGVGTSAVPPALAGVVGTGPVSVGAGAGETASVLDGRAGLAVGIESSSDPQATSAAVVRAATKTNRASLGNVRNRTGESSRRNTSLILSTLPTFQHGQRLSNGPTNSAAEWDWKPPDNGWLRTAAGTSGVSRHSCCPEESTTQLRMRRPQEIHLNEQGAKERGAGGNDDIITIIVEACHRTWQGPKVSRAGL